MKCRTGFTQIYDADPEQKRLDINEALVIDVHLSDNYRKVTIIAETGKPNLQLIMTTEVE